MSGYLSNLLTSTTDRYNSLRRNLLTSEGDGDTEDDSHICRVLRAYYTEKTHTLPDWLPPDPKKVVAPPPPPPSQSSIGSSYANLWNSSAPAQQQAPMLSTSANNSRSALSDLWDPPAQAQPGRVASPVSLRGQGRQPLGGSSGGGHLAPQANVRPLPSQRAGSYQSQQLGGRREGVGSPQFGSSAGGGGAGMGLQSGSGSQGAGGTAQERLKARLWGQAGGGRAASPGGYGGQGGQQGYGSSGGGGRWG
ncbi:hypothetical protein KVT40_006188 [Elsinoe batatas]|uniref:Mso1 N-terminal domain-containing protein n=1 Tax=Elsinoe batatas TaxID=2601811 RepID=A0A8K0PEP1_9PEZI|nr:hypothetical protein KVT40_006188 [Elsinoe batatas]